MIYFIKTLLHSERPSLAILSAIALSEYSHHSPQHYVPVCLPQKALHLILSTPVLVSEDRHFHL